MLPFTISFQRFEPVAWRHAKVIQDAGLVHDAQLS
jgi:hypothetical protein